jgi:hypothetical protein
MQLQHYQRAIEEFNTYINNLAATHGEGFVDVYTFVQKGRCLTQWNSYKKWDKKVKTYATFFNLLNSCSTSTGVL